MEDDDDLDFGDGPAPTLITGRSLSSSATVTSPGAVPKKKTPSKLTTITPQQMAAMMAQTSPSISAKSPLHLPTQSSSSSSVTPSPTASDSPSNNKDRDLRQRYEDLLKHGSEHPEQVEQNLYQLRKMILLEGLPATEEEYSESECSLRGRIWKVLLRVKELDAQKYINLVEKGSASLYQKIRNDTFRTFKTNRNFAKRVPEDKLIRVLNAFLHSCGSITRISYVQGMNVVCGTFLYVMPELDAFYAFSQCVKIQCPLYFHPGIEGAFAGLQLLDDILKVVDFELYSHLIAKNLKADVYAMPPVLSFSACTPPLDELLHLWDFLLAFGLHLNIVCVAAQIVLMREDLLTVDRPNSLLRTLPSLDAGLIISVAIHLVRQLPEELYQQLVTHPFHSKKGRKYNTLPKNFKSQGNEMNLLHLSHRNNSVGKFDM